MIDHSFTYTFDIGWRPVSFKAPTVKSMAQVAEAVCMLHGVPLKDVMGPDRTAPVCRVRFAVIAALRAEKNRHGQQRWSLPAIGRFLGRDHTTILNALRRIETRTGCMAPPKKNREIHSTATARVDGSLGNSISAVS